MRTSRPYWQGIKCLCAAVCCWLLTAAASTAAVIVVTASSGYIFDQNGTNAANRLPVDSLCYLVADIDRNGFSPLTSAGWAAGDDRVIMVSDLEFPGGTKDFDLASGQTEPGLFSRELTIDLAQFGAFSNPIPFALVWFPTYKAAQTEVSMGGPAADSNYGFFTRAIPRYPGTEGWFIQNAGGSNYTVDPFATSEFGGSDPAVDGVAIHLVLAIPEPSTSLLLLFGSVGFCGFFFAFGSGEGTVGRSIAEIS